MSDSKVRGPDGPQEQQNRMPGSKRGSDKLYDLDRDSENPNKNPEAADDSLQAEPSNLAGNGSQDRRPGKGQRTETEKAGETLSDAESSDLEQNDIATGRERNHDFSKDNGAELERMPEDGKLDKP